MPDLLPFDPEEERPKGSYVEFLNGNGMRGCSCSAGCLQFIIALVLAAVAVYMLFFR